MRASLNAVRPQSQSYRALGQPPQGARSPVRFRCLLLTDFGSPPRPLLSERHGPFRTAWSVSPVRNSGANDGPVKGREPHSPL